MLASIIIMEGRPEKCRVPLANLHNVAPICQHNQPPRQTSRTRARVFDRITTMLKAVALVAALAVCVRGHGHVTLPASTRNGGLMSTGGYCGKGQCFWFSNNVEIPGESAFAFVTTL